MAQIRKGTEYSTGMQVTGTNLNAHVDNAVLLPGAISEQTSAPSVVGSDTLLINQSGSLRKATVQQITDSLPMTGYLKRDGSNSMTGELVLANSTPSVDLAAASRKYVADTVAGYLPLTGGTISSNLNVNGNLTLSTASVMTLGADPLQPLQPATKQYVDTAKVKCSGYFSNTQNINPPNNVVSTAKYLSCSGSRNASSTTLTINFSGLASQYKNADSPFFLAGQYIGVNTVSGISARLYKITGVDYINNTFTITTPETTVFTGQVQLTCVYDNAENNDGTTVNCKSVYLCVASNKFYVNYWKDIVTQSKTNTNPTEFFNTIVIGQGNSYNYNTLNCKLMVNLYQRNSWQFDANAPEGFGSWSTGCHIGYFYNSSDGSDYPYQYRATFAML